MQMSMSTGGMNDMTTPMPMKHHMWMWFHTKIDDTVLFDSWKVTTTGEMVWTCAVIFFVGVAYEALKWLRWRLDLLHEPAGVVRQQITTAAKYATIPIYKNYRKRLFSGAHFVQTVLFGLQILISYVLMLVFMTFSVWLGLAVTLGAAVGYYIFGSRKTQSHVHRSEASGESSGFHS